jgi:hypothetical protein
MSNKCGDAKDRPEAQPRSIACRSPVVARIILTPWLASLPGTHMIPESQTLLEARA